MFYSQSLLSREGPLGNIWMAAYFFKRLRRDQIAATDISSAVDKIKAEAQISYRVMAQLLLGIVKIFSKKVEYLQEDCNQAVASITKYSMSDTSAVSKEAISKSYSNDKVGKGVPAPQRVTPQESVLVGSMEMMCVPQRHVSFTIPERFELDTFELKGMDQGDNGEHQIHLVQDESTEERSGASLLNEFSHKEILVHAGFSSECFTPVDDFLPSDMMEALEINGFCNSSTSEVNTQKTGPNSGRVEESGSYERIRARRSLDLSFNDDVPEPEVHPLSLQETLQSDFEKEVHDKLTNDHSKPRTRHETKLLESKKSHIVTEVHPKAIAQVKTSIESNLQGVAGMASPKPTVSTPARREGVWLSRKRKNTFDENIVLSNETVRLGIRDASSLVCKRIKLPYTVLDAWKAFKIPNLQHTFMDTLIPLTSSDFQAVFQKRFSSCVSLLNAAHPVSDEVNALDDMPSRSLDREGSFQERTCLETPDPARSEDSTTSQMGEMKNIESSFMDMTDTESELLDLELGPHEGDSNGEDIGWPSRTRAFAHYLHKRFQNRKGQEHKGIILSMSQILEGKTRTECARFFYETLVLKDRGCIDVEQDSPYNDIILTPTPQLEAVFRSQ